MKNTLREDILDKRDRIRGKTRKCKEYAIRKRLFATPYFRKAETVLFYASFRSEVSTMTAIENTLTGKKRVVLPVVDTKHKQLKLFEVLDISELEPGYMGIPEPLSVRRRGVKLHEIDIEIIPGIGFDISGNRLGYGAGYYDKLLSHRSMRPVKGIRPVNTIALAFEEQIVEKVPSEPHDIRVDMIITDQRSINCR